MSSAEPPAAGHTHKWPSQKRQPSYPKQDEWLNSLPPTDSGDNDDRHAKRKETKRVSQPLCYADVATLPRIPYPSMHLSAVTQTPPPIHVFPRSPPTSPRPSFILFVFHSISIEGKRDVGHLVDPSLFTPGSHKPPFVRENEAGDSRFIFFFQLPPIKGLMWLKVITSVFCPCFWC